MAPRGPVRAVSWPPCELGGCAPSLPLPSLNPRGLWGCDRPGDTLPFSHNSACARVCLRGVPCVDGCPCAGSGARRAVTGLYVGEKHLARVGQLSRSFIYCLLCRVNRSGCTGPGTRPSPSPGPRGARGCHCAAGGPRVGAAAGVSCWGARLGRPGGSRL